MSNKKSSTQNSNSMQTIDQSIPIYELQKHDVTLEVSNSFIYVINILSDRVSNFKQASEYKVFKSIHGRKSRMDPFIVYSALKFDV